MSRKDTKGLVLKTGESQRSDGRYMYRYIDPATGNRQSIYARTLLELREKEKNIRNDIDNGINISKEARNVTLNDMFDLHMTIRKLRPTTKNNYIRMYDGHVRNSIGRLKVTDIRSSSIKSFYSSLSKKEYSKGTIKLLHGVIQPSLDLAVDDKIISTNPADGAFENFGRDPKQKQALTTLEQNNLIKYLEGKNIYNVYLPMIQIMLGTAVRCGELIGLTWKDVDMEKREIHIDHQLIYNKKKDSYGLYKEAPKTKAGIRKIPMTETVYNAFEKQREYNRLRGMQSNVEIDGLSDFIFITRNGNPIMPGAVNNLLCNIVTAYNRFEDMDAKYSRRTAQHLPNISAHIMRHTACTRMAEAGMDVKVLQYIMGHDTIAVTMEVYNHVADMGRVEKELKKFEMQDAL